jgi:hypothetical protein
MESTGSRNKKSQSIQINPVTYYLKYIAQLACDFNDQETHQRAVNAGRYFLEQELNSQNNTAEQRSKITTPEAELPPTGSKLYESNNNNK